MPTGPSLHLRGHVLPDGERRDLWIHEGRLTFEKPRGETIELRSDGWILPGLVDCHAHLSLASPAPGHASPLERVKASAMAQRDAGVLLVREPGDPADLARGLRAADGFPRIVTGGRHLAPPGRYFPGLAQEVAPSDLVAAVTATAKRTQAWVKLVLDFPDGSGVIAPHWRDAEVKAAVKAAHDHKARVAVHATCARSVHQAIEAGVDSLEHGTGLDPSSIEAMARKKIAFVPTLIIHPHVEGVFRGALSPAGTEALRKGVHDHPTSIAKAAAAGVPVYAGTDAGMAPHGAIGREVAALAYAGLAPEAALGAASWSARKFLGYPGIEEGASADLVVFDTDPRLNVRALGRPATIILDGVPIARAPLTRGPAAH